MKYYFKSTYEPCVYSENWYGTLDYAPRATVLLYNDNECFCIGYLEDVDKYNLLLNATTVTAYSNEEEALLDVESNSIDIEGVYFGAKLLNRWDEVAING